jgi:hypothetical protein
MSKNQQSPPSPPAKRSLRGLRIATRVLAASCTIALACATSASTWAQCPVNWADGFGAAGLNGAVYAQAVYTDAKGPSLYVGGSFTAAQGEPVPYFARRSGESWTSVAGGVDSWVRALAVFDDGRGPALYVGGLFTQAGGQSAQHIARWDGRQWEALGSGLDGPVYALTVHDDGTGAALYVGGQFQTAGGIVANDLARWDGANWSALGTGSNGQVNALASFDIDGAGPAAAQLYIGGVFNNCGGAAMSNCSRWTGVGYAGLGAGLNSEVHALAVHDDGSGNAIYFGGSFTQSGSLAVSRVARFKVGGWSALGAGCSSTVRALAVFDAGSGAHLHAGGQFSFAGGMPAANVARWNGAEWQALAQGANGSVHSLTVHDDGMSSGPALYVGGTFTMAGGLSANRLARWFGASWSPLGGGSGLNGDVRALARFEWNGAPALAVGGDFNVAGELLANRVALWQDEDWTPLGSGLGGGSVRALVAHDEGDGLALYAAGSFSSAGGAPASFIARWKDGAWSTLGSGLGFFVNALASYDDGSGLALYAGGAFLNAGGAPANRVARWKDGTWTQVGAGLDGEVRALLVVQSPGLSGLYAGGSFVTSSGTRTGGIARWDGSAWQPVGVEGVDGFVRALALLPTSAGPRIAAGGAFHSAGGITAFNLALFDGSAWSATGLGLNGEVRTLAVHDAGEGEGSGLYVGGDFTHAGGQLAPRIARYAEGQWSALDGGLDGSVRALASFDADGLGSQLPTLYAGGSFDQADAGPASSLARWELQSAVSIDVQPIATVSCTGQVASFSVQARGGNVLMYQWLKRGEPLSDGGNLEGAHGPTLVIDPVLPGDPAMYQVVITDACGSKISEGAMLTLNESDSDGDGSNDCVDLCPNDPAKTAPLECGCGQPESCLPLNGSPLALSIAAGGAQQLALRAGPEHGGRLYLLSGSASGTSPGFALPPLLVPLNFDAYTQFLLSAPNAPPLQPSLGFLDARGEANASFALPPASPASALGPQLHHAYVLLDLGSGQLVFASNAVSLQLLP